MGAILLQSFSDMSEALLSYLERYGRGVVSGTAAGILLYLQISLDGSHPESIYREHQDGASEIIPPRDIEKKSQSDGDDFDGIAGVDRVRQWLRHIFRDISHHLLVSRL